MHTMTRWTATAVVPLAMLAAPAAAQESTTWRWDGTLAEGRTVNLHNVNGSVRFESGSGDRVEVEAEKRWRRGDPDDVRIEARQLSNGNVVICAMWRRNDSCSEGGINGGDREWNRNNDVSVHFVVRVPAYANVDANTVNGSVEVAELRGRVDANTVNGNVEAASSGGPVRARTVNGSIRARGLITDDLEYNTVNGSIEIELPANTNADVSLRTTNGRVTSDFPITFTGEINPRRIEAKVGNGGPELRARTVNGGIRLIKQ
ncbi:DUF4097 family beta strand repeat-containing protein [Pseudogemmatithrix spongiicola]|uniref:DUF4097 family beta strand repeat-containing protein n=2 Tax=Pseudogemmatithrix spongiicola TaxID=3062599 RepID=A0AA49K1P7_9BACT|nr:DUF4097 family beta strand repeat-containing protein [Gemmatimonadaceae bacterium 'strain 138']WKW16147.1 DUF4097 family beta strand repeat-containing protein [Gemmatimonadaceae bacterium 'strain 318']